MSVIQGDVGVHERSTYVWERPTCRGFLLQGKFLEVNCISSMLNPFKEFTMVARPICTEVLEDVRKGGDRHDNLKEVVAEGNLFNLILNNSLCCVKGGKG